MFHTTRTALIGLVFCLMSAFHAGAQQQVVPQTLQQQVPQPAAPQAFPQQPPVVQAPQGFQLNQLQQAHLDQVLNAWQLQSGQIVTFKCSFERWEYDLAFGPKPNPKDIPLNKNRGDVSYHRPDKGSFQITEVHTFQEKPATPAQPSAAQAQGDWVKRAEAIGEHWVCDGKSIFEYRHDQKQLVERPIPPQLQGQAIADGPLPFLFGAEAAKLKARYWMRVNQQANQNPDEIWLVARPRHQAQAADFSEVEVILDRQRLLPKAMQVQFPSGNRHVYMFDIANAKVNSPLDRFQALFTRPRTPGGYKRVVEQMPVEQAAQPAPQVR